MAQGKGAYYEDQARKFLELKGLRLIEKNYRCRNGEVDLIMQDRKVLVFVEVKYRSSASHGSASEMVTTTKQQRLCRTAAHFLTVKDLWDSQSRFDVVTLESTGRTQESIRIQWLRNAFEYR